MSHALKTPVPNPLPKHIAIIMDGNRRWALQQNVPRLTGHKKGIEAARRCVEACLEMGIEYLTLYAFSSENWKRSKEEVDSLFGLLRLYLNSEFERMEEGEVHLKVIGSRENLPADIVELLDKAEQVTANKRKLYLTLAINYGSHGEIVEAVRKIARQVKEGALPPDAITEAEIAAALETGGIPDPDLVIRTGGEKRLSNFLLWQSAYAELVFLDAYWPDFDERLLKQAIEEFQARERRFGARE